VVVAVAAEALLVAKHLVVDLEAVDVVPEVELPFVSLASQKLIVP
jgi:hypothetical protein